MTWARITMVLAIIPVAWFIFAFYAQAQADSEEQVTIVQAVEKLTAIHIRQATVAEAKAEMRAELCASGELDVTSCPAVVLPPVTAPPPTGDTE